jgi:hypothetical protein
MVTLHQNAGNEFLYNSAKHELFAAGMKGVTSKQKMDKIQLVILQLVILHNSLQAQHDESTDNTKQVGTGSNPAGRIR